MILSERQQPTADGYEQCNSMQEIGIKLLKSVGCAEIDMNETMIAEAISLNDWFIERLQQIRAEAEGQIN